MSSILPYKITNKAFALLIIGGCIVGIGPIFAKVINASVISIVLYRMMLPIPILFSLRHLNNNKVSYKQYKTSLKDLYLMIPVGLLFSLDLVAFYMSLKFTSVASATLLSNLSPIFLVTYALLTKRKLTKEILWPILSMLGLMLLCGVKSSVSNNELLGNSIALLAATFFTGYILLVNKLGGKYNSIDIMLGSSLGGAIFLCILCFAMKIDIHITSLHDFLLLLLMSWGTQLIGQTILTKAISTFPPSFSSLGILIDPVAAAIFAWLLLDESLSGPKMIGAGLILISIFCAYRFNSNRNLNCIEKEGINT